MFKTLLAGTLLSTGLLAGGAVGTEDVKTDKLKSNEKIEWRQTNKSEKESAKKMGKGTEVGQNQPMSVTTSVDGTTTSSPIHNLPEDAVPAIPNEDVKSNNSQTFEMPEDTESQTGFEIGAPEKMEHAKTVERSEGTDFQQGKNSPTKKEIK
ncbi:MULTISPECIES: hypothetical protein [Bacillus]|uniref:hypothetical protein n=1 Tax=Bacillus TaxID=1386 RepID=UPI000CFD8B22|nr:MULTISPECIES: hypothetical protein [Bacillus]PQZ54183.1 hypothetical protein CQZ94_18355 [Bacillus sp. MYb209]